MIKSEITSINYMGDNSFKKFLPHTIDCDVYFIYLIYLL